MLMQFNSIRPMMNVGKTAIFFAKDFTRIPESFRSDYSLHAAAMDDWSNVAEIEAEVDRIGYTWGVEAAVLPGERKRVGSCALMIMKDHD